MKTLDWIIKILTKHKEELRKNYDVKEIGIFGSFVRGEQKKRSDIDILVEFNGPPNLFLLIDLEDYLKKFCIKRSILFENRL
jgi:predicted nucleotidyltransferase